MTNHIKKLIKEIALFNGLEEKAIHFLSKNLEEHTFHSEAILSQGQVGSELFIITDGMVEIHVAFPGNISKKTATLDTQQIFGEVSFLSRLPITASVYSKDKCTCLILSRLIMDSLRILSPESEYILERNIVSNLIKKIVINIQNTIDLLIRVPPEFQDEWGSSVKLYNPNASYKLCALEDIEPPLLEQIPFIAELNKKQQVSLLKHFNIKCYQKGSQFSKLEPDSKRLLIIYSGAVMAFINRNDELYKSIAVLGVGDLFTQNCLFDDFYKSITYVACEKCVILELKYEDLEDFHKSHPSIYHLINKYLHCSIANSVYITNRLFIRTQTEYKHFLK